MFPRRRSLPRNRRLVCDLLHFARQVPLYPLERTFDVREVVSARSAAPRRIAWSVLFLKAYALLARDNPEFRQTYLRWPWPHLYEHPENVGMLAMLRGEGESESVHWGRFTQPEQRSLGQLQDLLDRFKNAPVEEAFRSQTRLSRLPGPVRRLAWWLGLNVSGHARAREFGTFGLTTLSGLGAVNYYHPTPLTTSLTYGPIGADGRVQVTLMFDHRVMDGSCIARALANLEAILCGPIVQELREAPRSLAA
jgi:hypothetical protein